VFVQCRIFGQGVGGSSDVDVRNFCCKNVRFLKMMVCRTEYEGEGVRQCGHFWTRAKVQFFVIFSDFFYERSLTS